MGSWIKLISSSSYMLVIVFCIFAWLIWYFVIIVKQKVVKAASQMAFLHFLYSIINYLSLVICTRSQVVSSFLYCLLVDNTIRVLTPLLVVATPSPLCSSPTSHFFSIMLAIPPFCLLPGDNNVLTNSLLFLLYIIILYFNTYWDYECMYLKIYFIPQAAERFSIL